MRLFVYLSCLVALGCQNTALTSAKLYLQEDEPAKAKEQLQKALEIAPDDPEVYYVLGKVCGLEGDFQGMAAALDRSLQLSPKFSAEIAQLRRYHWAREYNRGVSLAMAETPDYSAARQAFETATVIDPSALQSWRNLAFTQYQLKDLDGAIATYQRLLALAPGDTSVLSNLGSLCLQQQRYREAVEAFRQLSELVPGDFRPQVNLGIAYEKMDSLAQAEAAYRRATELGTGIAIAHYGLGNFYWNRGRYEAARDAYARAVALDPTDADARFNLAMTYLRLEDDNQALPLLEQLSKEMPDNKTVWEQLSLIYARQNRIEASKAAEARAKELGD